MPQNPSPTPFAPEDAAQPIAIIGMGARFPGAADLAAYAELLLEGRYMISELPPERFDAGRYYDADPKAYGKSYSKIGAFLEPPSVDPAGYGLSADDLRTADTVHLWALEVARATFEQAGVDPFSLAGRDVGVIIGNSRAGTLHSDLAFALAIEDLLGAADSVEEWNHLPAELRERIRRRAIEQVRARYPQPAPSRQPAFRASGTASLVARAFGLSGRHLIVDAACASSLAAIGIAVRALQQGRMDLALAGGAAFTSPHALVLFSNSFALSGDGSYPFDSRANGFVASDGAGMLLLARLEDALAAGHRIQGIIHAVGGSCDGRGKGLWAPSSRGQILALRNAYAKCSVDPGRVGYIEAHGTSTALGDATEVESLTKFFGPHLPPGRRIPIGSVKSNIGHAREAAGIAGLLKVMVAFEREVIPPSIQFREPSPEVDWDAAPVRLASEPLPWPRGGELRVAGVDSFGIGGLNYHVVLEEAPSSSRLTELLGNGRPRGSARRADSAAREETLREPIAIVGIGCVVPGAKGPKQFWERLRNGEVSTGDVPADRWRPGASMNGSARGGFVRALEADWKRFRMPPATLRQTDPLHLMLLECALDALEDANIDLSKADRERIAITVGSMFGSDFSNDIGLAVRAPEVADCLADAARQEGLDGEAVDRTAARFLERLRERLPQITEDSSGNSTSSPLASRIAMLADIQGAACAVDSAYAASLVALESACESLWAGTCDVVLWAGGDRGMGPLRFADASRTGVLSSDGRSAPFEAEGAGLVLGEGAAVCVLKRLSDARSAGDRIYTVIRGIGSAAGFSGSAGEGPDEALASAIEKTHRSAGVDPSSIGFVEMLPSGRTADDERLLRVMAGSLCTSGRRAALPVGSVSMNVGHAQGAAGALAIVKAALSLHHGTIPPAAGVRRVNPAMPDGLELCGEARSLPVNGASGAFAAMTSLSPDGVSYHVILEGVPVAEPQTGREEASPAALEPVVIRAASRSALSAALTGLASTPRHLTPGSVHGNGPVAAAIRAGSGAVERLETARKALASPSPSVALAAAGVAIADYTLPADTCFLFPGQGSQYPGMLRDVAAAYPAAARRLMEVDSILETFGQLPLSTVLWDRTDILNDILWTQMSVLGGDLMMLEVARAHGLVPAMVTGHSYGDYPALVAAGSWSLEQVIEMTVIRCEGIHKADRPGGMVAAFTDRATVARLLDGLPGYAAESNVNAPDEVIVSGEPAALEAFLKNCEAAGVSARRLPVPAPFHSELMRRAADLVTGVIAGVHLEKPSIPFLTSSGARFLSDPDDLRQALVDQFIVPVDFIAQIETAYAAGCRRFVEIGPGNLLTRLATRILRGRPAVVAALNDRKMPGIAAIESALAMLRVHDHRGEPAVSSPVRTSPAGAGEIRFFDVTKMRASRPAAQPRAVQPLRATQEPEAAGALSAIESRLIDLVCEQSGYPRDLVGIDADLEADLGIDTVKQAQIVGTVRSLYDLPNDESLAIRDLPTLRKLAAWVEKALGGQTAGSRSPDAKEDRSRPVSQAETARPQHLDALQAVPAAEDSQVLVDDLASRPEASQRYVVRTAVRPVEDAVAGRYRPARLVIVGENTIGSSVAAAIGERGVSVEIVSHRFEDLSVMRAGSLPDVCVVAGVQSDEGTFEGIWRLLQAWVDRIQTEGSEEPPTLSVVTALGGALGAWNAGGGVVEGGGFLGLARGLRREVPSLRQTILDIEPAAAPEAVTRALLEELDSEELIAEVGLLRGRREVPLLRQAAARLDPRRVDELRSFGYVILTGGARGITAELAIRLAQCGVRRLHLLGSTPLSPGIESWRPLDPGGLDALRQQILERLRAERGPVTPVEWEAACEPVEKALEIDRNLRRIESAGASAVYHTVDVSNADLLKAVLDRIRTADGPVEAIIHGAGYQVSRAFVAKSEEELRATLAPKVDACRHLMQLTEGDPVRLFAAFGSVAGRFGGLGQADYSLASEMLARLVGRYAADHPETRAFTFAWPAWDEVGMAMHRRTRHLLESRGRVFMSVAEGGDHFLRELFAATPEIEVTVGPDIEAIAPPAAAARIEALRGAVGVAATLPLADAVLEAGEGSAVIECRIDADRDPFLTQHRQGRVAIVPAVVMIELIAEAARVARPGDGPIAVEDVVIHGGVKLADTRRLALRAEANPHGVTTDVALRAHHVGPRGHLLAPDRMFAAGKVRFGTDGQMRVLPRMERPEAAVPADYRSERLSRRGPDGWYHGPDLATLEEIAILEGNDHWGLVRANPAEALRLSAGERAWLTPAPALDGCLAACVGVAGRKFDVDGLPSAFGRIVFGRAPKPGERCPIVVRQGRHDDRHIHFDFTLYGDDGAPLIAAEDYVLRTFTAVGSRDEPTAAGAVREEG